MTKRVKELQELRNLRRRIVLVSAMVQLYVICILSLLCAEVSPYTSRLILQDSRQFANGQSRVTVGIELRDENGTPLSGKSVTLQSNNPSFTFVQPSAPDLNGFATGYVTCRTESFGEIWAFVDGIKIFPNMLENSSGEMGLSLPTGWSQFTNQPIVVPNQQFIWDTSSGSNTAKAFSMNLSNYSPLTYELSWFQKVQSSDLLPGTTYTVNALIRAGTDYFSPGALSGLFLNVFNEDSNNNPVTSSKTLPITTSSDWERLELSSVVFPPGATQVEVSLDYVRSTGAAFFDNVRMMIDPGGTKGLFFPFTISS